MQNWQFTLHQTLEIAKKLIEAEDENPVLPYISPEEMQEKLALEINQKGLSEKDFFNLLEELVMLTPRTASKGFFNQLWAGRNLPALSGEILAALLNSSMYTYKVAGPQVLVEREVIRKMNEKIGYKDGDGTFTPGGSMSNMVAMMIARNEIEPTLRSSGFSGKKLIAYTSQEGHYSTVKNAGILGLGRENVRLVESDSKGRLLSEALDQAIEEDLKAGYQPFFINATAGTTVLGAFDPFVEIAQVAQKQGLWFHIDGAFGAGVLLSQKYRALIKGSELADSFTWNAHKMMGVPLTASVLLLKEKGILRKHLSEKAEYLYQSEDDYNPGEYSLQCGRRNDALKVWAAWKYYGDEGYEARVNQQYEIAQYAVHKVKQDPQLDLVLEPECLNVCFQVKGQTASQICNKLNRMGLLKVGYGKFKKQEFIRMVCIDPALTEKDLDLFFDKIHQALEA